MKRIAILLALTALLAFAPSAFACWKCDTIQGCYGTEVGVPGRTDCEFDGACHLHGFCQGFAAADDTQLAASYTVATVHVVEPKTEKAQQAPLPEPQQAEKATVAR